MYYDCQLERWVNDQECREMLANDTNRPKVHKCIVCENRTWCEKIEKDKNGCNDFILNGIHIFAEVFKKQNKDKK